MIALILFIVATVIAAIESVRTGWSLLPLAVAFIAAGLAVANAGL